LEIRKEKEGRGGYKITNTSKGGSGSMPYDGDVRWLPVRTAAKMLQVSMTRVYQLIERGDLLSIKVDSTVLVSGRSVEARTSAMEGRVRNVA
jgi:hypothetical protein